MALSQLRHYPQSCVSCWMEVELSQLPDHEDGSACCILAGFPKRALCSQNHAGSSGAGSRAQFQHHSALRTGGLSESHGQYGMGTQHIFLPWRLHEFYLAKLLMDNLILSQVTVAQKGSLTIQLSSVGQCDSGCKTTHICPHPATQERNCEKRPGLLSYPQGGL